MKVPIGDVIWNPQMAVEEVKKDGNIKTPIVILLIAAIISAISGAISAYSTAGKGVFSKIMENLGFSGGTSAGWGAIVSFLMVFIGGLIIAVYHMMVMKALNTKASYFGGVGTIAMTAMPASVGYLILAILGLAGVYGALIGAIIAAIFTALAAGTLYYATKTFFETDMITAFIGVSAFVVSIGIVALPAIMKVLSQIAPSS